MKFEILSFIIFNEKPYLAKVLFQPVFFMLQVNCHVRCFYYMLQIIYRLQTVEGIALIKQFLGQRLIVMPLPSLLMR